MNKIFATFRKLSSSSKYPMSSTDIQLLATYGTLRDDDDSGAAWTNDFIKVSLLFIYLIDKILSI